MSNRGIFILSGGSGTRLWPLSRESLPKQFHDLSGSGEPLLIETVKRLRKVGPLSVITTKALSFPTVGLLNRYRLEAEVMGEPQARNTAAAVALATWTSFRRNPNTLIGIFPADHVIKNETAFARVLETGFEAAARGEVVMLGIQPDRPATEYGYIDIDGSAAAQGVVPVRRFIEKPPREKAAELIATGHVVWNAGMFLFRADVMKQHFAKHLPDMAAAFDTLKPDLSNLADVYAAVQPISVDYGIMERLTSIKCVPADMGWTDIGSWEEVSKHCQGQGRPIEVDASGNFYTGVVPHNKRVAFVGVQDVVAVDTPDALLVVHKGSGQSVRDVVSSLVKEGSDVGTKHSFEERPWGRFEVLMDTDHFKSKRITVLPGQKLSYQSHKRRAEHWVIVKGQALVVLNDVEHPLKAGQHIFIPLGAKHRIGNPGTETMEFIEIQTGDYFGEDDITRYSDAYGRAGT